MLDFGSTRRLVRQIFDNIFSITVFISVRWSNGFFKMTNNDSFLSSGKEIQSLMSLITRKQFSPRKWGRQNHLWIWKLKNVYYSTQKTRFPMRNKRRRLFPTHFQKAMHRLSKHRLMRKSFRLLNISSPFKPALLLDRKSVV